MKKSLSEPYPFLPLTPAVFHILLALSEGEQHGYRIMQIVQADTQGQFRMGPGTLYGTIKRMLNDGLIEETGERPDPALDDERRRYYRLTGLGNKVAQAEAERLANLVSKARSRRLLPSADPSEGA
jgi:DNA-binding PadR family transcriptional regulator